MSSTGSQGLEVSCELCEEILAVGVAGEAGQALLDQHVGGKALNRIFFYHSIISIIK